MQYYKLKKYQKIILLIFTFLILTYLNRNVLIYRSLIDSLQTKTITAVIISEKEGMRGVHLTSAFTYYYKFEINGKVYKNPSYNKKYKIGDSIKIIYALKYPFINRNTDE
jgi:exoribonuclease R